MKVNMEVMEAMLYFWTAVSQREKVSESYLRSIADRDEMKKTYVEEFNAESVRLVLSAITNRELLNTSNKRERRFWNNNMWMLEDLELMQSKIAPLKTLNLSDVKVDAHPEVTEVCFFPGQMETAVLAGSTLYINFFMVHGGDQGLTVEGKPLVEYIRAYA
ncbi:MAG: hypothetical protein Q4A52_06040 [Bacillota bacterium]|nr:hypothetical protein [Bacillota bacterium]